MTKQSDITWNSLSNELKQLITDRLGEPMAKDIAAMKRGTYNLDDAIASCLLYDLKKMRDNAINLGIAHRLFPEIWPSQPVEEPIFLDWETINSRYNWFAVDKGGVASYFTHKPKIIPAGCWVTVEGDSVHVPKYFSGKNWKNSLQQRPEPQKETCLVSKKFQWPDIHPDYLYIARDEDGRWTAFVEEPVRDLLRNMWNTVQNTRYLRISLADAPNIKDWKDSLIYKGLIPNFETVSDLDEDSNVLNTRVLPEYEEIAEPIAEVLDNPIFLIRLEHSGDPVYISKLVEMCKTLNDYYPTQILTETEVLFEGVFTFKTQCSLTALFRIAMDLQALDANNIYGFSIQ